MTKNSSCSLRSRAEHGLRLRLIATALAAAVALVVVLPAAAVAHAGLVSSDPEDGSGLRVNPGSVTLVFTDAVPPDLARVSILEADGVDRPRSLPVTADGATGVRATLTGRETGTVRLSYRVTSADGHPISGEVAFTVAERAASSSQPPGRPAEQAPPEQLDRDAESSRTVATAQDAADGSQAGTSWLLAVGAALLLAISLAVTTLLRRAAAGRRS